MEVRRPFAGKRGGEKVRVKGKSRAPLCREGKGDENCFAWKVQSRIAKIK